jgi:haloacid dehalogenase superfamily, subfamily IA, variant 1 with third motif having Dx(3-4)D or Dx(3-4)E
MINKGVLFDKDGTLTRLDDTWTYAVVQFCQNIKQHAPGNWQEIWRELGFVDNQLEPNSPLSAGTYQQVANVMQRYPQYKSEPDLAVQVEDFFTNFLIDNLDQVKLIGDVVGLFKRLKKAGFAIGVTTADSYRSTMITLDHFQITQELDFLATADNYPVKPNQQIIEGFCQKNSISADKVLMIGDSCTDLAMGKYCYKAIGVGNESLNCPNNEFEYFATIQDIPYESYF